MRTRRASAISATIGAALLALTSAGAQERPAEAARRPRVALVLSGGGARGIAHVGVLQVLEELRIPIDAVAGTSMGAIVGGLYAAGYSPEELDRLVRTLDWSALLLDRPERRNLPFRAKVDDLAYLSQWELGVGRDGVRLPSGLISGHRLGATLDLLALRAAGIDDFDRLPLPFRAVAADATRGDTVVLDHGALSRALRASMAVPGLFAPIEVEGRLLVDGGVVDNLPVDAARAMGVERVIAVDLGEALATRSRPKSIGAVLSQSLDVLSRREVERALAGADVVIRPAVGDHGLLDFDAAPELLASGVAAARAAIDALRPLAIDDLAWRAYLARQRRPAPALALRSVSVDAAGALAPERARRAIESTPGSVVDPARLAADLDRLWELGDYDTVGFELTRAGEAEFDLEVVARNKPWGPNFVRTGLSLVSDLEGTSHFNLLGALTRTRLNRFGGELRVQAQIGELPVFGVRLDQPIASSRVPFVSLATQYSQRKQSLFVGDDLVQYRFRELVTAAELGLSLGRYGELRAGARRTRVESSRSGDSPDGAPRFDRTDAGYRAALIVDQLDRVNFPRRGLLISAELYDARAELGADEKYRRFDLQSVAARTFGRHSAIALLRGTSALGGELPASGRVQLGGLFNLSGLPPGRVSGNYGGVASLLYLYRLGRLPKFGEGIYAGLSLEAGNAWESSAEVTTSDLRHSFALLFGADTLLGPLYLGHGHAESGEDSFYLYLGRTF